MSELTEARALAKELGYLPLALAQARAYMAEIGKSLAGYRRLLQESRPAVLDRGRPSPDYPASIAKTWQLSIVAAEEECAAARPLLELLAFFAPDALPVAVLASAPAALPQGLREEMACDEAIGALKRFSLIQAEKDALTMHRLVQVVTRDGLDAATAKIHARAAVRLVNAALPRLSEEHPEHTEHTNWLVFRTLLPHAVAAAEVAVQLGVGLQAAVLILNQTGLHYWARAEPLLKRAITIIEKNLPPDDPHRALAAAEAAEVAARIVVGLQAAVLILNQTGPYYLARVEPLLKRMIAILEKTLPPDDPHLVQARENYTILLDELSRSGEAAELRDQDGASR